MSIPHTYLVVASSPEGEADGVIFITHLLSLTLSPWTFHPVLSVTEMNQREARPSRVNVSSYRIGNLAHVATFREATGCCNKPHRPFVPWWTGSRLEKEVTIHLTLNRPQANTQALPLLPLIYPIRGYTSMLLLPNYYMSQSWALIMAEMRQDTGRMTFEAIFSVSSRHLFSRFVSFSAYEISLLLLEGHVQLPINSALTCFASDGLSKACILSLAE
jgi:hypothetical protein